jgi:hypothetical protein
MRPRLIALASAAAIGVAVLPAHAAAPKPQITDPAGDANGFNDQGVGAPIPSQTSPADDSGADITSVTFASTFVTKKVGRRTVKTPTGFTVTMALAAPPTPETFYRIVATIPGCDQLFIEYGTDVATGGTAMRCPSLPGGTATTFTIAHAAVKNSTIVWTIPTTVLPAGTTLSSLSAQTRLNPAAVTAPQIDYASSSATFTVGK